MTSHSAAARPLRQILGLGFGLAIAFGGTVGVGILRLPGTLAATLGDARLIILFWILGGVYALLGATSVAELSAMIPRAGGFYVYAQRAFGNGGGFIVGWSDWLNNTASVAYAALTAAAFLGVLWPPALAHPQLIAISIITIIMACQWIGLRSSSALTAIISITVGVMLLTLVGACFVSSPAPPDPPLPLPTTAAGLPLLSFAMLAAVVAALRAVLVTYDGWYSPIYFAEENANPGATMPRAVIGGTLLVAALYVVINIGFLRVLPMAVMAGSKLPAADVAGIVLPAGGATLVTLISLTTVLSLINAALLLPPRILLAMARDGFCPKQATIVSASGTPRVALAATGVAAILLILTGSFEQIVALSSVLFLLNYLSAYLSVLVLRRREPDAPRPYRAWGFPVTPVVVLLGSVLFLVAAVADDPRSAVNAGVVLAVAAAVYWWVSRRRKAGPPGS